VLDQLPALVEPRRRVLDEDDEAFVRRQVVEQARRLVEEQRQVILDARRQPRLGDVAIDRAARRLPGEMLAKALPEAGDALLVERKLAGRQNADAVGLAAGQLRLRIEQPERLDLVVEEIHADGLFGPGRENVEQRAPD